MKSFLRSGFWFVLLLLGVSQLSVAERTTTYFHTDGGGSVVAASDQSGTVLWRKTYAPFGEQTDSQPNNERLSFTGKPHDDVTGLTYFGARYYDPAIGRFTSVDPVAFLESNPMSFNRYAYGNNNPYRYVDPDGRLPILIPIAIFIAKEAAAEVASQATGGATDFLSVRRMGTKGAKFALKKLSQHLDDLPKAGTKGASGELVTKSGNSYHGNSINSSASGGDPRAPMHPETQQALDVVKKPSRTHGGCCEIDAINKSLWAGDSVRGAKWDQFGKMRLERYFRHAQRAAK